MSDAAATEAATEAAGRAVPARDLPFVDALAAILALFAAHAVRAIVSPHWALEWDGIEASVRGAVPIMVAALLLSAAALGLYGGRAAEAGLREHAAAGCSAVAVAVVAGAYWGALSPATIPLVAALGVLTVAFVHAGRVLYRRRAAPAS